MNKRYHHKEPRGAKVNTQEEHLDVRNCWLAIPCIVNSLEGGNLLTSALDQHILYGAGVVCCVLSIDKHIPNLIILYVNQSKAGTICSHYLCV